MIAKNEMVRAVAIGCVLSGWLAAGAWAAHPYVYPGKGQSQEQMQKDEYECHQWAVQQTGFDPSQPVEQSVPRYAALRDSARGAALGAVGGAIGGDAGMGAAIGAGVGALSGILRDRRANAAQARAYKNKTQDYDRAYDTCLTARGYTVG